MGIAAALRKRGRLLWKSLTVRTTRASSFPTKMSRRWQLGQTAEARYWRRYLGGYGGESLRQRLDPDLPLQAYVRDWLDPAAESATVLDVGAGPLTTLGKVWEGHRLEVTPVDVIAAEYDKLLDDAGVVPPVRTVACSTEDLAERFGENRFDVVHIENALDHHADPIRALAEMVRVVRVNGHVILRHARNEAETQGYSGLHQWNLAIEDNDYAIWNKEMRASVRSELGGSAELVHLESLDEPWELVVIEKRADASA
jgi:SAM-dependent methyltransferase